jgi:hypothetical protein
MAAARGTREATKVGPGLPWSSPVPDARACRSAAMVTSLPAPVVSGRRGAGLLSVTLWASPGQVVTEQQVGHVGRPAAAVRHHWPIDQRTSSLRVKSPALE